jgi:hypothetical protein
VRLGDERTHVGVAGAVPGDELGHPLLDLVDQLVGDGLDRDQRRDRHAALTGRAEAGVDGGVGGQVEVGVGQDEHVVLGATEGLDALAVGGAGLVDVLRDRGGADEGDGLDVGVSSRASTASLSPWTTLMTPSGRPASCQSLATALTADGSFSDGLMMTALPQAMAIGTNHSGTMAGKLNGLMTATTPSDWRIEIDIDAGRDVLGEAALEQVRDAAGELGDLEATHDLTEGVGGPCRARR